VVWEDGTSINDVPPTRLFLNYLHFTYNDGML